MKLQCWALPRELAEDGCPHRAVNSRVFLGHFKKQRLCSDIRWALTGV